MRRFLEVKGEQDDWWVIDTKGETARIVCVCKGFKAPLNAEYICQALEHYHASLYEALGVRDAMGSSLPDHLED